jgi:adenylyltransferase/sulfurtransferase
VALLRCRKNLYKVYLSNYLKEILMIEEISATDLKRRMDAGEDIQLIDVRQPEEWAFAKIEGAKLIPLGEILNRMGEIDETRETVIHCKAGMRSANAVQALQRAGFKGDLKNLKGGITAWSNEVDPKVPKY